MILINDINITNYIYFFLLFNINICLKLTINNNLIENTLLLISFLIIFMVNYNSTIFIILSIILILINFIVIYNVDYKVLVKLFIKWCIINCILLFIYLFAKSDLILFFITTNFSFLLHEYIHIFVYYLFNNHKKISTSMDLNYNVIINKQSKGFNIIALAPSIILFITGLFLVQYKMIIGLPFVLQIINLIPYGESDGAMVFLKNKRGNNEKTN